MTPATKRCPSCTKLIPQEAEKCPYCGTTFSVGVTGYCSNCHTVRSADKAGHCSVCGTIVIDRQVESRVVSLAPVAVPAPAPVSFAPSAAPSPRRNRAWLGWLLGVGGLLLLCGLVGLSVTLISRNRVSSFKSATPDYGNVAPMAATVRPESASGSVMLWYSYNSGSPEELALLELIDRLENRYPAIQVDPVNQSLSAGYIDAYNTMVAAGSGPDLLLTDSERMGSLLDAGSVALIGSPDQPEFQGIQPYVLEALTRDGLLYGVPFGSSTVALYYNKSMISMPPQNMDSLTAMVKAGYPFIANYGPYFNYGFFPAFGGQLYAENGRCIADQGGYLDAMLYLLNLQDAGARFTDYGSAEEAFKSGESSMNINGLWAYPDYRDALGSDLGAALLPSGPAGPSRPWVAILAYFLNPISPHREAALQVAYFLTSQESAQYFIDQASYVPVREDVSINDPIVEVFSQSAAQGTPWPQANLTNAYWDPFQTMFDGVLLTGKDPQVALEQACRDMNAVNGIP